MDARQINFLPNWRLIYFKLASIYFCHYTYKLFSFSLIFTDTDIFIFSNNLVLLFVQTSSAAKKLTVSTIRKANLTKQRLKRLTSDSVNQSYRF